MLTGTDLQFDVHAPCVVVVGADRIGGAAIIGEIPVLVFQLEVQPSIGFAQCIQQQHHQFVDFDIGAAGEIEIG